jgi:small subunit ribosomal protein S17
MTDDEKQNVDETSTEGSDGSAAGPVAEGDPPANTPEGAPSTPPAEEAPEAAAEAAADEQGSDEQGSDAAEEADEAPAAEKAPAKEPSPEDDLPWKERKRLERSRQAHEAGPALSDEERVAQREQARKVKANLRRAERQATRAKKGEAKAGTPVAERTPNAAKVRQGIVVSDKGQKSITVRIDFARRHPTYEKIVRRSRTLHAHDERNEAGEGDIVRVVETRPLSKTKRWRLVDVVEKAK